MQIKLEVYFPFRGERIWKGTEQIPMRTTLGDLFVLLGLTATAELAVLVDGCHSELTYPIADGSEVVILFRAEGG